MSRCWWEAHKVREITEAGNEALPIQVDVRNYDEIQAMFDQTIKKYQRLDVLVCTHINHPFM